MSEEEDVPVHRGKTCRDVEAGCRRSMQDEQEQQQEQEQGEGGIDVGAGAGSRKTSMRKEEVGGQAVSW